MLRLWRVSAVPCLASSRRARVVLPGTLLVTVDLHVHDLCNNMLLILLLANGGMEVLLVDYASVLDEHFFMAARGVEFWCARLRAPCSDSCTRACDFRTFLVELFNYKLPMSWHARPDLFWVQGVVVAGTLARVGGVLPPPGTVLSDGDFYVHDICTFMMHMLCVSAGNVWALLCGRVFV